MSPITTWDQLARFVGTTMERADLDFKRDQAAVTDFEIAKDVAALANGFGGCIVVGAETEEKILCKSLPGIPRASAIALSKRYEEVVGTRCRPRPAIDCALVPVTNSDTAVVLAVNVAAASAVPVGVDLRSDSKGREGDPQAWKFPMRTTSNTVYLSPDQFGGLENMSARRSGALLAGIPEAEMDQVCVRSSRSLNLPSGTSVPGIGGKPVHRRLVGALLGVDYRRNISHFRLGENRANGRFEVRIPLDWVSTVWRDTQKNEWMVMVDCVFVLDGSDWVAGQLGT